MFLCMCVSLSLLLVYMIVRLNATIAKEANVSGRLETSTALILPPLLTFHTRISYVILRSFFRNPLAGPVCLSDPYFNFRHQFHAYKMADFREIPYEHHATLSTSPSSCP